MREFEFGLDEPKKEEPKGPSPEQAAKEREEQLVAQAREKELEAAAATAKAQAMEQFVREQFAQGRQAPPKEAVMAQEELGLTEEEILDNPTAAIAKISEQMRRQQAQMREYQERATGVIGNLAKSNFKAEMSALSKERYAEWLTPYVEEYFRKNPEEAFQEGRVRSVYNELVGQNIEELDRLHREKTAVPAQRQKVVEPSTRFSAAPQEPVETQKKSKLSEEEAFFLAEMNRRNPSRYAMTEDEWLDIRSGKKFPKKISTDIQVRGAKPNVSY